MKTRLGVLNLLKILRSEKRYFGLDELEELTGTDKRKLRYYFGTLKQNGFPVVSKTGLNGGYMLNEEHIEAHEWVIIEELLKNCQEIIKKIKNSYFRYYM